MTRTNREMVQIFFFPVCLLPCARSRFKPGCTDSKAKNCLRPRRRGLSFVFRSCFVVGFLFVSERLSRENSGENLKVKQSLSLKVEETVMVEICTSVLEEIFHGL